MKKIILIQMWLLISALCLPQVYGESALVSQSSEAEVKALIQKGDAALQTMTEDNCKNKKQKYKNNKKVPLPKVPG